MSYDNKLKTLYFDHNYDASSDPKLIDINRQLGLAGIGSYWILTEFLYRQEGRMTINDIKAIAWNMHADENVLLQTSKLAFKFNEKGNFYYSEGVIRRIAEREKKSKMSRMAANTRWKNQKPAKEESIKPEWYDDYSKNLKARTEKPKEEISMEETKQILEKTKNLFED